MRMANRSFVKGLLANACLFISLIMTVTTAHASPVPGDFLSELGTQHLYLPQGVAADSDGNVYVADSGNNVVRIFKGATLSATWEGFYYPCGIAVDREHNIYVADTLNSRVQIFDNSGALIRTIGSWGTEDGQFWMPVGVAIDGTGNLYVADYGRQLIQVFDKDGAFLRKWGGYGDESGKFSGIQGINIGPDGNLYAADTYNDRIQVFTLSGDFLRIVGPLYRPASVAVDGLGNVYALQYWIDMVTVFNKAGSVIGSWGGYGYGPGRLNDPYGISIGEDGKVYVADTYNNRVQVFQPYSTTYKFEGFFSPIKGTVIKSGNTLPVKFGLTNEDGSLVTTAKAFVTARYQTDYGWSEYIDVTSTGGGHSDDLFKYDIAKNQYVSNLNIKELAKVFLGTWELKVKLDDGTSHFITVVIDK